MDFVLGFDGVKAFVSFIVGNTESIVTISLFILRAAY